MMTVAMGKQKVSQNNLFISIVSQHTNTQSNLQKAFIFKFLLYGVVVMAIKPRLNI